MDRLCYEQQLIPGDELQYILVDFVPDVRVFRYSVDILRTLQKSVNRIKYVETAYQEFLNQKESMKGFTEIGQMKLEMKARSFFVEFGIFLNHWEKRIGDHPKREEFKRLYDQLTHDAYDTSDHYAMATIIRNYAIHSADIIHGTVWGNMHYDVSTWKEELLKDKGIPHNKKTIIERQPAEFIMLHPVMRGALKKLKEIQTTLVAFTIDKETQNALVTVAEEIKKIKEYGDKQWFFADDEGALTTIDKDGRLITYIQGKCLEVFAWRDFDELIATVIQGQS